MVCFIWGELLLFLGRTKRAMLYIKVGVVMAFDEALWNTGLLLKRIEGTETSIRKSKGDCRICVCKCYGKSCKSCNCECFRMSEASL